jgi:N-acyl-D-amino-acid deacylase
MARLDVLIRGGRVVDGTGNPWFWSDVGIKDGRIAGIGRLQPAEANQTIDAEGRIVCPGFIDLHTHSDLPLLLDGDAHSAVRQGVTLDLIGESSTVAPLAGRVADEFRREQQHHFGLDVDWTDFSGYFDRVSRQGIAINLASGVSPLQIRRVVVGYDKREPTPDEIDQMKRLTASAMEQGAFGLTCAWHSGGPEFTDEVVEMARVVATYGGYYGVHVGSEGAEMRQELDKALRIAREARIPTHIYHIKLRGRQFFGQIGWVIDMIEAARAEGLDVTANQYPYTAMHHSWGRLMPRWVQDGPRGEILPQFADAEFRQRIKRDPEFKQYNDEHGGYDGIFVAVLHNPALKQYEGKSAMEIARLRGQDNDPAEVIFDLVLEENNFPQGVFHNMSEEDVKTFMRLPWVAVASDGRALNVDTPGVPHPRSFGTNVRVLGKYVRDERIVHLEDAIRKMTSLPAQVLRLSDRGLLREDNWADIVVFDADRVADRATFANPKQYPLGVDHVLVNGTPVIRNGEHTGARPGKVVHGPGLRAGAPTSWSR